MAQLKLADDQISFPSSRLFAIGLAIGTFNVITANPVNLSDSLMSGYSAGGSTASTGTAGVMAASFSTSGAETGIGSGEGGLGTATPYPASDFGVVKYRVAQLKKIDGDKIGAAELLSSVSGADAAAPVFGFLAYRSDASANQKWRIWFYYLDSTGAYVPLTPDTSLNNAVLYIVNVATMANLPVAGFLGAVEIGQDLATMVLGAGAVGASNLASDSVTTVKILNANVTTAKIADANVTTAKILDANVTAGKLASDSVTTAKILNANVTTAKIADDAVTLAKFGARPEAEETTLTAATTWDLAHLIDADHVKGVQIDVNMATLHWSASPSDSSHFSVSGNGGTGGLVAMVTFGASVTGVVQARYYY